METARCKAFTAAARYGSFRSAAEELGYTTSAVSQLIAALEEELHVKLFRRSRKGVELTADGERMRPVIMNFILQEERIYETAAEISGVLVGEVRITAYPSICAAWLPELIRGFREKYPGISLHIDDSIRRYVIEALAEGRADIGFFADQHDFEGEWFALRSNPMVAVVAKDSPYAGMDAFPLRECENAPLIQSSYGKDRDIESIFEKYGISPNILATTRNSFTAAAMVQSNMGVLLVNELSTHIWNYDVKILPLDPPQYVELGMGVSALSAGSPAVKAFAWYVREKMRQMEGAE